MTGMKPNEVIQLKQVPLVESYPQKVHCLRMLLLFITTCQEHDDPCKRATDRIWPKKTYRLSEVVLSPGN